MKTEELVKCVEVMITKASQADKSEDAMRFSQAACNAANAMNALVNVESKAV